MRRLICLMAISLAACSDEPTKTPQAAPDAGAVVDVGPDEGPRLEDASVAAQDVDTDQPVETQSCVCKRALDGTVAACLWDLDSVRDAQDVMVGLASPCVDDGEECWRPDTTQAHSAFCEGYSVAEDRGRGDGFTYDPNLTFLAWACLDGLNDFSVTSCPAECNEAFGDIECPDNLPASSVCVGGRVELVCVNHPFVEEEAVAGLDCEAISIYYGQRAFEEGC